MKKVADDITASSLFSPGYPTEGSITASFPMPFAKDSFQTGTRMQKLQKLSFSTNQSTLCEYFSGSCTRPAICFCFRVNQDPPKIFSLSHWFCQPCPTTGPFIYCASETENEDFSKHKNYPNPVNNNCLVLTYK